MRNVILSAVIALSSSAFGGVCLDEDGSTRECDNEIKEISYEVKWETNGKKYTHFFKNPALMDDFDFTGYAHALEDSGGVVYKPPVGGVTIRSLSVKAKLPKWKMKTKTKTNTKNKAKSYSPPKSKKDVEKMVQKGSDFLDEWGDFFQLEEVSFGAKFKDGTQIKAKLVNNEDENELFLHIKKPKKEDEALAKPASNSSSGGTTTVGSDDMIGDEDDEEEEKDVPEGSVTIIDLPNPGGGSPGSGPGSSGGGGSSSSGGLGGGKSDDGSDDGNGDEQGGQKNHN